MAFPNAQIPNQMLARTPQGLGSLSPAGAQQSGPTMARQTNMPGGFGGAQVQQPQGGFAQQLQSLGQPQVQQPQGGFAQQLSQGVMPAGKGQFEAPMPTQDQIRAMYGRETMNGMPAPRLTPEQMNTRISYANPNAPQTTGGVGYSPQFSGMPPQMQSQLQSIFGQFNQQPQGGMGSGFDRPMAGMPLRGFGPDMRGMGGMRGMMPGMGGLGGAMGGGLNSIPPDMVKRMLSTQPQQTQAMPQNLGGLAAYGPQAFKEGGSVGLRNAAQQLQDRGRGGDTMLAHINPQEAELLKRLGGSGTINPDTGLPEYFVKSITKPFTKPLNKALSKFDDVVLQPVTGAIQDVVQSVAKATGPVGQIVASAYGGPIGAALYAGLAGEDGFNFKRGLMAGAMTWGAQNLAAGFGGAESAAPVAEPGLGAVGVENPAAFAGDYTNSLDLMQPGAAGSATAAAQPTVMGQLGSGNFSGAMNTAGQNISNAASGAYDSVASGISNVYNDPASLIPKNALANQDLSTVADNAGKFLGGDTSAFTGKVSSSVLPMYVGATGIAAIDEMEKFKKEQEEIEKKQDEDSRRYMDLGLAELKKNPFMYAEGGNVSDDAGITGRPDGLTPMGSPLNYATGGTPRFLSGGGDGMSDSIPATIDGKQPARIADGEFIVPADVVSHLGNGSSKAGAKQLYSMMDKIRTARTGTKKQGKQINPNKYLPA